MELSDSVTALKGVGKVRAEQLANLGILTLGDLIRCFPRSYEDRTKIVPLSELVQGEPMCFLASVTAQPKVSYVRKGLNYTRCTVTDGTEKRRIVWFNQPWMSEQLIVGASYYFYGTLTRDSKQYELVNPVVERQDAPPSQTRCIIPVYSLTKGLSSKMLSNLITAAMDAVDVEKTSLLPADLVEKEHFPPVKECYREIHHPTTAEALSAARARIVFEEFFIYSIGICRMRLRNSAASAYPCKTAVPAAFYDNLKFSLTGAQQRVLGEISADLMSGKSMNRLVQGDVGSGKTMVALGAILQTVENGYQAALMAPTELLARQHYKTISEFVAPMGISCVLLTGSGKASENRRIRDQIQVGCAKIVIGTHALFSEGTEFRNLGLVVIDEQHRFGVRQRASLAEKGGAPHILVLSATPIPRTLALILYGDLDISVIDELPPGRKPIGTHLVSSGYRTRLYGFIQNLVAQGNQVYVVCPAIEDNETTALTSAETRYEELKQTFPDISIGLVHGKLRPEEKDAVMSAFVRNETSILVSTTVIEVGVDVPNACLMVIEDADRFGLSQLHQLRGRVGRGSEQSYCILVSDNPSPFTRERLKALCSTGDGFEIARQDLKQRGPGDFFGYRQSGLPAFETASLADNMDILTRSRQAAQDFLETPKDFSAPEYAPLFSAVDRLFRDTDNTFN